MLERSLRKIWAPENVVPLVPQRGIQHTPMFLRRGEYADNQAYIDALNTVLPNAQRAKYDDGESLKSYLAGVAHRANEIIMPILEATTVIVPQTCIQALKESGSIATDRNGLKQRVLPVLVVDEDWAHTRYFQSSTQNPDGPRQVITQGKAIGAVTIAVTKQTLKERLSKALESIMNGVLPVE